MKVTFSKNYRGIQTRLTHKKYDTCKLLVVKYFLQNYLIRREKGLELTFCCGILFSCRKLVNADDGTFANAGIMFVEPRRLVGSPALATGNGTEKFLFIQYCRFIEYQVEQWQVCLSFPMESLALEIREGSCKQQVPE